MRVTLVVDQHPVGTPEASPLLRRGQRPAGAGGTGPRETPSEAVTAEARIVGPQRAVGSAKLVRRVPLRRPGIRKEPRPGRRRTDDLTLHYLVRVGALN